MSACMFCSVIAKEVPAVLEHEDSRIAAFRDIRPKARVHVLVVPRRHLSSLARAGQEDRDLLGDMMLAAKRIAEEKGLNGYKIHMNVGRKGGQEVDHIHLHLLAD